MITTGTDTPLHLGLVGPVLPFRSGIARYTTQLHRALAARDRVTLVTFRRLYPGWLFPGRSCLEPGHENHVEPGARPVLDSLNPATWLQAARILKSPRPDAVLITWWTFFLAPCLTVLSARLKRAGIPTVFICHNVEDHESAAWKRALSRRTLATSSRFLTHSRADAETLRRLFPNARIATLPLPVFDLTPPPKTRLPRRGRLELLFFGLVRPYKGLDTLVGAMERLQDTDVWLTIAGEWWLKDAALRSRISRLRRVELIDRFLPDTEAADRFARADAVVLPYRQATGAGVIALAYRYGKPVLATRVGGLPDVVEEGATGFLVPPDDPDALAAAIRRLPDTLPLPADRFATVTGRMTFEGMARCLRELAAAPG
jgi:glycosyltransferase involved in cell wall biosynthesis